MRLAATIIALLVLFSVSAPQQAEARRGLFKDGGIGQQVKAKRAERKAKHIAKKATRLQQRVAKRGEVSKRAARKTARLDKKAKKHGAALPVYTQEDRIDVPPPEERDVPVSNEQQAKKEVPQTLAAANPSAKAKVVLAKAAASLQPKSAQPSRLAPPDLRPTAVKPVTSLRLVLDDVERHFGKVTIISQCRPGARIAGTGRISKHASCNAIDFTPPPGKYNEVATWLKANHNGGVGTYSGHFHHIHIDLGGNARWHN